MSFTTTIQIRGKGGLTLPIELRRKYHLSDGDVYTLVDLGEGAFVMLPGVSMVERHANRVTQIMAQENVSLDDVLNALDDERQEYYRQQYEQGTTLSG
jgi:bifunctional DNA-binding transcriptional regulator/antitoxin component of YhaV-PrlF toxin-antitoxin module